MAFILIVVVFQIFQCLFVCPVKMDDVVHPLNQENNHCKETCDGKTHHVCTLVRFKKQEGYDRRNEQTWKKKILSLVAFSLEKGNHCI